MPKNNSQLGSSLNDVMYITKVFFIIIIKWQTFIIKTLYNIHTVNNVNIKLFCNMQNN
jgi:hypothetical protein